VRKNLPNSRSWRCLGCMVELGSIWRDSAGRATLDIAPTDMVTVTIKHDSTEVQCICGRVRVFVGWRVRLPEHGAAA
jgi:hypothetical protein